MSVKSVSIIAALSVAFCVAAAISSTSAAPAASIPLYRHDSICTIAIRANMTLPVMTMTRTGDDFIPLHDYRNAQYFAPLEVGTPAKSFLMVYDTGSSDVWVPQRNCIGCTGNHTTYKASESFTSMSDGSPFKVTYGSGTVSGFNVFDAVTFGNVTVPQYNFASVTDASGLSHVYKHTVMDGIVGLAFPKLVYAPHYPLILEASQRGHLEEPIFSFYLGRKNGQDGTMDFGGIDRSKYVGELRYIPVIEQAWWTVQLDSIVVDGHVVSSAPKAIVDSGTSLLVGPTSDVRNLAQALGAEMSPYGLYVMPCSSMTGGKSLRITLSGVAFKINIKSLVIAEVEKMCIIGIEAMDNSSGPMWILGDVFMREYFTVFDYEKKRIGFANAL